MRSLDGSGVDGNLVAMPTTARPVEGPGAGTTTIVLADDHAVVRSAPRMLLEAEPDFQVVAEAGAADAAGRYVRGHTSRKC